MTPLGRAALGAAFGGTLALAFHPASRPYFAGIFDSRPSQAFRSYVPDLREDLSPPQSLSEAALWLRVGLAKERLTASEKRTLRQIAARGEEQDRTNAFWPQVRAILAAQEGRPREAAAHWRRASLDATWNDYENDALQTAIGRFSANRAQAWPYAFLISCRSHATEATVEKFARSRLASADLRTLSGARTRIDVIRNGVLLRRGAKTMIDGRVGARMVDLAVYPPEMVGVSRPKRLYLGRGQLYETMKANGLGDDTPQLVRAFADNDGWDTIVSGEASEANYREMAALSALVSVFPGAALAMAVLGGIALLVSKAFTGGPRLPIALTVFAVASLSAVAWFSSGSWLGALAVVVCGGFVLFRPPRERAVEVEGLGPLFQFVVGVLALLVGLSGALWSIGRAAPAQLVSEALPAMPEWWIEPSSAGALAALFTSLLGLIAPAYALVYRVPTVRVLALGLRWFGTFLLLGAWIATLVGTPLAIMADRNLQSRLSKILLNEPVYYFSDDN